jgi:hypothetical protein
MRRVVVVALAAVLAAGCGGGQDRGAAADVTEYVGAVAGTDPAVPERGRYVVAVAIAADGKVVAYACDGLGSSVSLTGTKRDGRLDLRAGDGAARLRATVEAGRAAPLALSFTLVDGSSRTVRLGAAHASARLAGFDGYRLAFLDGGFGRGNPARGSTRLLPATPLGDSLLPVTGFLPPATIDR